MRDGFHNVTRAGGKPEALAVDILDNDAPPVPSHTLLLQLAAAAQQQDLQSGIRWGCQRRMRRRLIALSWRNRGTLQLRLVGIRLT